MQTQMNSNENDIFQIDDDVVIRGRAWYGAGRIKELLPHCKKAKVIFRNCGKEEIAVVPVSELRKVDLWY